MALLSDANNGNEENAALEDDNRLQFYSAWFCPFAQRVWIALLSKGIPFRYHEVNPYDKSREWLAISPKGLVPTIVDSGKTIWESNVIIEYLDERYPNQNLVMGSERYLYCHGLSEAYRRAEQRMLADHISKRIVHPFYQYLMTQSVDEQERAKQSMLDGLTYLFAQKNRQPYFGGKQLNLVDMALAPFALRFDKILGRYRNFVMPLRLAEVTNWTRQIRSHPAVVPTLAADSELVEIYERYANNTAKSKVADAVRSGTAMP